MCVVVVFDVLFISFFCNVIYLLYKVNCELLLLDLECQFVLCCVIIEVFGVNVMIDYSYEVDDFIGFMLWSLCGYGVFSVIVLVDKDFGQLLGEYDEQWDFVWNLCWGLIGVYEKLGVYLYQVVDYFVLCGDVVDNIFGVFGIGVKMVVVLFVYFGSFEVLFDCVDEVFYLCLCGVVICVV